MGKRLFFFGHSKPSGLHGIWFKQGLPRSAVDCVSEVVLWLAQQSYCLAYGCRCEIRQH